MKSLKKYFYRFRNLLLKLYKTNTSKGTISLSEIAKYLPRNPIIVEAGAHIGIDTLQMNKEWPKGRIFAFEPVPNLFEKLIANTKRISNINCFNLALGKETSFATMHISSGVSDASSSLLSPQEHLLEHPDVKFETTIDVNVTTLDSWAAQHNIYKIDFLWLDLQGYEMYVLEASPRILSSVTAIYTEVSLKQVYEHVPLYPEYRSWLENQGFYVEREELPWPDMGNVLFVRTNSRKNENA